MYRHPEKSAPLVSGGVANANSTSLVRVRRNLSKSTISCPPVTSARRGKSIVELPTIATVGCSGKECNFHTNNGDNMIYKILGWLLLLAAAVGIVWLLVVIIPIIFPIVGTILVLAWWFGYIGK